MASESRFDALINSLVEKLGDTPYSSNTINQISEHLEELTTNEIPMNQDINTVSVLCLDKLFAAMDNPIDFDNCLGSLQSLIESKCSIKLLRMLAEHVLALLETSADSPNFIQMKLKLMEFFLNILNQSQRQPGQFELSTIFSLEEILLYKLMDQIIICKDSSLQIMELKLFFALMPYEIGVEAAKKFFPGHLDMQEAIRSFNNSSNFDECYKPFLNCLKLQVPNTIIIDVNINYIDVGRYILKMDKTLGRLFVQFNCLEKYIKFCSLINGVELTYAVVHSNEIEHISTTRFESLNTVKITMWLKIEIALETIPNSLGKTLKFSFPSQLMEKFAYHMDDTFLQSFFGNIKNGVTAFSAEPNSFDSSFSVGESDGCDASIVDYDRFSCWSSEHTWSSDASFVPSKSSLDVYLDPGVDDFVTNRNISDTASEYYSAKDFLDQVENNEIQEQTLIERNTEYNTNINNSKNPRFDDGCELPTGNDCNSAAFQETPTLVNSLKATRRAIKKCNRNLFIEHDNRPGPSGVSRKVSKTYENDENNQNIPLQTDTSTPELVRKINAKHLNTPHIVFNSKLREIDQNIPVQAQKTHNIGQVDNNEADSSAMDVLSEDDTMIIDSAIHSNIESIFPDYMVSDTRNKNIRYNDEGVNNYPNTPNKNVEANHLKLSPIASIFSLCKQELHFPNSYENSNKTPEKFSLRNDMDGNEQSTGVTRVERKRLLSLEDMGEGEILKKAHKEEKFENQGWREAKKDIQKSTMPIDTTKVITIVRSSDASAGPSKAPATADKESGNAEETYSLALARTIRDNGECEGNGTTTSESPPHIAVPVPSSSTPKPEMAENENCATQAQATRISQIWGDCMKEVTKQKRMQALRRRHFDDWRAAMPEQFRQNCQRTFDSILAQIRELQGQLLDAVAGLEREAETTDDAEGE